MSEPDDAKRLRELERRLAEARGKPAERSHSESGHAQAQLAWRMVIELVSGIGIGFVIGYGLDTLLGTRPFLMIVFIFLGLAAGIKTMMRSAEEVRQKQAEQSARDDEGDAHGD